MRRFSCSQVVTRAMGVAALLAIVVPGSVSFGEIRYFGIRVVDDQTGRGVPLVELQTVNDIRMVTDSGGFVAFHEPGLMNQPVFFSLKSHGYEFRKDGFGYRGKTLVTQPGGRAELRIRRLNIAERLYRITGAGIYRDSLLLEENAPIARPLLNAKVLGSDSVMNAVYNGRLYWFWGDTNRPRYPLGNFHVPGATSALPGASGFDPEQGVDLSYFADAKGFAKETAKMPGRGPTWIGGTVTVLDQDRERMFAGYAKIEPPLKTYERGLVEWNPETNSFDLAAKFPLEAPLFPRGHTFLKMEGDVQYVYFSNPFPWIRVQAKPEHLRDPARYEAFTCLRSGSRQNDLEVDRDENRKVRYGWKADTNTLNLQQQQKLQRQDVLKPQEALIQLRDVESGNAVLAHSGSAVFNAHRNRWVLITVALGGDSLLGEVWWAEADTPLGPWGYAVKVVTHEQYSFYNPKLHPLFDQDGGRRVFFEGTYTAMFSGNKYPTPRYNYNQIMYGLDLDDPRMQIPMPFKVAADGKPSRWRADVDRDAPFWSHFEFLALERAGRETRPVYRADAESGRLLCDQLPPPRAKPLFHAFSSDSDRRPDAVVPLWEFKNRRTGAFHYAVEMPEQSGDYDKSQKPLCYVWANPTTRP